MRMAYNSYDMVHNAIYICLYRLLSVGRCVDEEGRMDWRGVMVRGVCQLEGRIY